MRRVAFLSIADEAGYRSLLDAFKAELRHRGYVEGRDISIEAHWARNNASGLAPLAAQIAASKPDVIVTHSTSGVSAARKATSAIPIVFATAANPVEQGIVKSLQRPGGNVTGVVVFGPELTAKLVEIAREAFPAARRMGFLVHDSDPVHKLTLARFEDAAARFAFEPIVGRFSGRAELGQTLARLRDQKADMVVIPQQAFFTTYRKEVAEQALKNKFALLTPSNVIAEAGALLAYGTQVQENYRRAAGLVDKILRGAKPADLPVEQPERFELVVNRKTAKAIGLELPPIVMLRADRVID